MKRWCDLKLIGLLSLQLLIAAQTLAQTNQGVESIRVWHSPDSTRVVFDITKTVDYKMFELSNPTRVVVDIENASLPKRLPKLDSSNKHLSLIRTGRPKPTTARFVFELKKDLSPKSFLLTPNKLYGYRLVIDFEEKKAKPILEQTIKEVAEPQPEVVSQPPQNSTANTQQPNQTATVSQPLIVNDGRDLRPLVIAIDAGHGGEDPGAIGFRGTYEKKITFEIATRLKQVINQDPAFNAFLVRTGDYFIDLHKRRMIAKSKNADMFISIHADAFHKRSANGFSVYALSQRGATSAMARALAAKENASDLIGGVSLADKDDVLAKVLVDLSMNNTISESVNFGGRVLQKLKQHGRLHSKRVEQAGFAVLKSPDIPSILIETGYITNPNEEKNLRSSRHQDKIAKAVYGAIKEYFEQTPYRSNTQYASVSVDNNSNTYQSLVKPNRPRYHKVKRGDSLSRIAAKYGVSVRSLKRENNLKSNVAVLGKRLKLPSNAKGTNSRSTTSTRSSRPAVHIVKSGDSLSKISARYNVTISSLKKLNKLRKNTVYVGQKIKLPGGVATAPAKPRYHKVKRGDTLSEIAEKYGKSVRAIMAANGMRSKVVRLGQRIKIPN